LAYCEFYWQYITEKIFFINDKLFIKRRDIKYCPLTHSCSATAAASIHAA